MSKKMKISRLIIKDYEKLISDVSEINGILYHHESIFEIYSKHISKVDSKKFGDFRLGSHFHYNSPYDGKMIWGDFYKLRTGNFTNKVGLISRKANNYYVALAYEAFEKFLRSITARIIINNKKAAQDADETLGFSSYKSCIIFLQSQYRNNSKIISLLRKLSLELDDSFKKNPGLSNFLNFYRVYSKCRNHIIHSNDFIDIRSYRNFGKIDEKFALRYFGVKENKQGSSYIIDTTNTHREVLATIASFAYLIITSFDSTFIK